MSRTKEWQRYAFAMTVEYSDVNCHPKKRLEMEGKYPKNILDNSLCLLRGLGKF